MARSRPDLCVDGGVTLITPHEVLLRIAYVTSKRELSRFRQGKQKPHQIQVSMSPEMAIEMGALLEKYAKALQSTVPPRESQN